MRAGRPNQYRLEERTCYKAVPIMEYGVMVSSDESLFIAHGPAVVANDCMEKSVVLIGVWKLSFRQGNIVRHFTLCPAFAVILINRGRNPGGRLQDLR